MSNDAHIYSVSELNQYSRDLLETELCSVWVAGEISNLALPSSGHWYFSLKDDAGQIRCAMFRNRNFRVRQRPENGQQVLLRGKVSIFVKRGDYQLIVDSLEDAGHGRLQRQFEELKARLASEGLFASEHKKALPELLQHVAIITSPSGAALQDFLSVFRRRFALTRISVLPSAVQGEQAEAQLVNALQAINRHGPTLEPAVEAVVLARGGGSLEDLWPFNGEALARAIYASELPVVSAVGHETDFTIADLAADLRAPTPSAAAELLCPDREVLATDLNTKMKKLQRAARRRLAERRGLVAALRRQLRHPASTLREQSQRVDELETRTQRAMLRLCQQRRLRLQELSLRLDRRQPGLRLRAAQERLQNSSARLRRSLRARLQTSAQQLQAAVQLLDAVSPVATLGRGYAIVTDERQRVLRDARAVEPDSRIEARLAHGRLRCRVESRLAEGEEPR